MSGAAGEGARTLTSKRAPDQDVRDRAVDERDLNLLMQAGAGSGKTSTLIDRIERILTPRGAQLSGIVAITFTEKAADELKERLRERCDERIAGADSPERREHWRAHRHAVATAHIGTIHGFCSRLLRVHALRLGLDPRFSVLDEARTSLKRGDVLRDFVVDGVRQSDESVTALVWRLDVARLIEALGMVLAERGRPALADLPTTPDGVLAAWAPIHLSHRRECLAAIDGDEGVQGALATLRETRALDSGDKLAVYQRDLLAAHDVVGAAGDDDEARLAAWLAVEACGPPGNKGSAKRWPEGGVAAVRESGRAVIDRVRSLKGALEVDEAVEARAAELTAHFCASIPDVLAAYDAAKRAESVIDFDDLVIFARDLIRDHLDVRAAEQARFAHILVDEFQDTDPVQRELIWYLAEDGARARAPEDVALKPGKLFVVGDAKQSIYRFRGADVAVYDRTRHEFTSAANAEALSLTANFRSQAHLVAFFNEFFSEPSAMGGERDDRQPFEATYEHLTSTRPAPDAGPDVTFVTGVFEQGNSEEQRERTAACLASHIAETVRDAALTVLDEPTGEWREPRWGDIMFLVPTMSNIHIYERALRAEGVPYYVVAGKGFFNRPEIIDVAAVLSYLDDPRDEVSLARVLRSAMFGISDEGLYRLASGTGLADGLGRLAGELPAPELGLCPDDLTAARRAAVTLAGLRRARDRQPLPELLRQILDETQLPALAATRYDGRRAYANLAKLIEIAREYEASESAPLGRFIEYIQTLRTEEIREGEAPSEEEQGNAVTLMTIHKSKGLQRPIVVAADLARQEQSAGRRRVLIHPEVGPILKEPSRSQRSRAPAAWRIAEADDKARDQAERRRLLYVALTRARDRLIVSSAIPDRKSYRGTHVDILLDIFGDALATPGALVGDGWMGEVHVADDASTPRAASQGTESLLADHIDRIAEAEPLPDSAGGEHGPALRRLARVAPDLAGQTRFTVTELSWYLRCPLHYRMRYVEQLAPYSRAASAAAQGRLRPSERGTVVHRTLQRLGRGPAVALPRQVEAAMRESGMAGHDRDEVAEIVGIIERFAASDTWQRIEGARELRSEATVVARFGAGLLEGQVDALFIDADNRTHLLDYKTGRVAEEGKRADHIFQVGAYAAALERCGWGLPTSVSVHYLADDASIAVDPGQAAAESSAGVERAMEGIRSAHFPEPETCDEDCGLAWVCERARR